jgi:hypothetical protein
MIHSPSTHCPRHSRITHQCICPPLFSIETIPKQLIGLEDMLSCPISFDVMRDPVVAKDGFTYERQHIEDWIRRTGVSPMTSEPLQVEDMIPNILIRQIIESSLLPHLVVQDGKSGSATEGKKTPTKVTIIAATVAMQSMSSLALPIIATPDGDDVVANFVVAMMEPKQKIRRVKKISRALKTFFLLKK